MDYIDTGQQANTTSPTAFDDNNGYTPEAHARVRVSSTNTDGAAG
jgi:hypothetical protein